MRTGMKNRSHNPGVIRSYIILLRPHQYLKNVFIFAPLFFALKITDTGLLFHSIIAFVTFCLASGTVYIFNDYHDIEEDRSHPLKKKRPLASGKIGKGSAWMLMVLLLSVSLATAVLVDMDLFYIVTAYLTINVLYTLKLKHVSLVDLFLIAIGFVLRVYAGAVVIDVPVSMWIVLMTFLLALFLGLAKRRDDILLANEQHQVRKSIDGYNLELVNGAMTIMASVIMVCYIMYTLSSEVIARFHNNRLYITGIFVLFGLLRYMQITFVEERSGDPTRVLLKDGLLQIAIAGWIATFIFLIY